MRMQREKKNYDEIHREAIAIWNDGDFQRHYGGNWDIDRMMRKKAKWQTNTERIMDLYEEIERAAKDGFVTGYLVAYPIAVAEAERQQSEAKESLR